MASQAAIEGRFLGGRPPYGYRLADAGPHPNPGKAATGQRLHVLKPDGDTALNVARIFNEFIAGSGRYAIAEGLTVCVTGASSGIGRAIAEHLGSLRANVFMMGRTTAALEASADKIGAAGGQAFISTFDVTHGDALRDWIQEAADQTGQLNVLINNAGVADVGASIADGDPKMWQTMFDVNVLALAAGCQAAIRVMRDTHSEGNIVNISSIATFRRESGMYGATKHAVNCINSTLRQELEDDPIRVTAILPGLFATNVTRNVDRGLVEGMAAAVGVTDLEFSADGRLPQAQIDQLQAAMSGTMGNVAYIAHAVEYVLNQPIHLNIEEIVVRPQKTFF